MGSNSTQDNAVLHLEIGDTVGNPGKKSNGGGSGKRQVFPVPDEEGVRTVVDTYGTEELRFQTPCTISGIGAGISSGMLGYIFGFAGYWLKERGKGVWKASLEGGMSSAKTFAILGGLYSGVSCFMTRLRQKNDAINAGVSGCSTGLVLGWTSGGPAAAVQSCMMFGLFSYFLDNMSDEAQASTMNNNMKSGKRVVRGQHIIQQMCCRSQDNVLASRWLCPCLGMPSYFS